MAPIHACAVKVILAFLHLFWEFHGITAFHTQKLIFRTQTFYAAQFSGVTILFFDTSATNHRAQSLFFVNLYTSNVLKKYFYSNEKSKINEKLTQNRFLEISNLIIIDSVRVNLIKFTQNYETNEK